MALEIMLRDEVASEALHPLRLYDWHDDEDFRRVVLARQYAISGKTPVMTFLINDDTIFEINELITNLEQIRDYVKSRLDLDVT